jgi:hypothetical protein
MPPTPTRTHQNTTTHQRTPQLLQHRSVKLHNNSVNGLRRQLITFADPLYGGAERSWEDVRHIAHFVPPHFTEPVRSASDLRTMPAGAFLMWTTSHNPIPREQVQLVTEKNTKMDPYEMAIRFVLELPFDADDHHSFTLPMRVRIHRHSAAHATAEHSHVTQDLSLELLCVCVFA